MSASNTDKFRKGYYGEPTTLASTIGSGDTTIPLADTSGLPTDTAIDLVIDRVNANGEPTPETVETVTAVISESSATNVIRGVEGDARPHLEGAVVEVLYTGKTHDDLVDGILEEHDQQGRHSKALKDSNNNEWLESNAVSSAVNHTKVSNAAAGNKPVIEATGSDTNIGLSLKGKGTGRVEVDGLPPQTFVDEATYDYVASGCVWSGDSYNSTRNASMTAGVVYIGGKRLTVAAVTARAFTASKDTYVGLVDAGNGTATVVYYDNTNNAASPSLATGGYTMLIAIIVTGASSIVNVGSINQGEQDKVLPIASSVAYTVTDSLGNLICNRDPNQILIGYRQITGNFSTSSTSATQITGLSAPFISDGLRKIKVNVDTSRIGSSISGLTTTLGLWSGTVGSGTKLKEAVVSVGAVGLYSPASPKRIFTPSAGLNTVNASLHCTTSNSVDLFAASDSPTFISIERR